MTELNNFIEILFNNNKRSRHYVLLYTINNLLINNDLIYEEFISDDINNREQLINFIKKYSTILAELSEYLNKNSTEFQIYQNEIFNLLNHIDYLLKNRDRLRLTLNDYWKKILDNPNINFKRYISIFIKIKNILIKDEMKEKLINEDIFKSEYFFLQEDSKEYFEDISIWLKSKIKEEWKKFKQTKEEYDYYPENNVSSDKKSTKYLYKINNNYFLFDSETKMKTKINDFGKDKLGLNNLNDELFRGIFVKNKNEVIDLLNKNLNNIITEKINPILIYTLLNKLNFSVIKDNSDNFKFSNYESWKKVNNHNISQNLEKYLFFCIKYINTYNINLLINQSYNLINLLLTDNKITDIDKDEVQIDILSSEITNKNLLKNNEVVRTVIDLLRKLYKSRNFNLPKYLIQKGGYDFDTDFLKEEQKIFNFGSLFYEKILSKLENLFDREHVIKINGSNIKYGIYFDEIKEIIEDIKEKEGDVYDIMDFYFIIQQYIHLFDVFGMEKISNKFNDDFLEHFIDKLDKLTEKEKVIKSYVESINDNNLINSFSL
jgi:hypothetical protein